MKIAGKTSYSKLDGSSTQYVSASKFIM